MAPTTEPLRPIQNIPPTRTRPPWQTIGMIVLWVALFALGLAVIVWPGLPAPHVGLTVPGLAVALQCLTLWRRRFDHPLRLAWLLTGVGLFGTAVYYLFEGVHALGVSLPRSAVAMLYLPVLPCYIVAMAIRVRHVVDRNVNIAAILDTILVSMTVTLVEFWIFSSARFEGRVDTLLLWIGPLVAQILLLQAVYLVFQAPPHQQRVALLLMVGSLVSTVPSWLVPLNDFGVIAVPRIWTHLLVYTVIAIMSYVAFLERQSSPHERVQTLHQMPALPLICISYLLLAGLTCFMLVYRLTATPGMMSPIWFDIALVICVLLTIARQGLTLHENLRLVQELRESHSEATEARDRAAQEARTDALTGLPNRRQFHEYLMPTLAFHRRGDHPMALLFIDIDHFKKVNDTHGHAIGDLVLRQVAQRLRHVIRDGDVVARIGGEEFIVLLPNTGCEAVHEIAERVRSTIGGRPIEINGDDELVLTVSIGVAVFPDDADSCESLLEIADQALYSAKLHGRNQVRSLRGAPNRRAANWH